MPDTHVPIPRCNTAERAALTRIRFRLHDGTTQAVLEPALGTLDERLGIIIRRLGGHTHRKHLSAAELDAYRTPQRETT